MVKRTCPMLACASLPAARPPRDEGAEARRIPAGRKGDAGRMCDEAGKNRVPACVAE